MNNKTTSPNIRSFYLITLTQVLSLIGSHMTGIALGIRIFNDTGNSTPLLLASFFGSLPLMRGGSFTGVLVDRWNRRTVLIITDIVAGFGTLMLLISFQTGSFQIWHLYLVSLLCGSMGMFQRPAMEASVTMMVPENHRDRANALRQITGPAAGMIAPVITGFIYIFTGVTGIMLIDLPSAGEYAVNIYSTDGRRVLNRSISSAGGASSLNISAEPDGIYLISVEGPETSTSIKYIKR